MCFLPHYATVYPILILLLHVVLTALCSKSYILRFLHFTHVFAHAHCCCSCIHLTRGRRSALNLYRLEETLRNRLRLLASVILTSVPLQCISFTKKFPFETSTLENVIYFSILVGLCTLAYMRPEHYTHTFIELSNI